MAKDIDWVGARSLRKACIVSFLACVGLAVPPSVVLRQILPGLGLLPLFISAVFSLVLLRTRGTRPSPIGIFSADALLLSSLIIAYVSTWVIWSNANGWCYYCNNDSILMLAAYATVPMLFNIFAHGFFVARAIYLHFTGPPQLCPNCAHQIQPRSKSMPWFLRGGESTVGLLADDEAQYHDEVEHSEAHAGKRPVTGITGQTVMDPEPSGDERATL